MFGSLKSVLESDYTGPTTGFSFTIKDILTKVCESDHIGPSAGF